MRENFAAIDASPCLWIGSELWVDAQVALVASSRQSRATPMGSPTSLPMKARTLVRIARGYLVTSCPGVSMAAGRLNNKIKANHTNNHMN
jgi:hypothetical protein